VAEAIAMDGRIAKTGLALAALLAAAGETRAVEFIISYVETQHEVRPRQATWNVNKNLKLKLETGGAISEGYTSRNNTGDTANLSGQGRFRDEMAHGEGNQSSWRVLDDNTLLRTWTRAQHVETMRVTVSGNTCKATIAYELKPGFKEYQLPSIRDGRPLYFTALSAKDIACRAVD
jgi:hypothetical protein